MSTSQRDTDRTEHLAAAAYFAKQVKEAQERLDAHVLMARMTGASWTEIGALTGTSKQAAQQRYGKMEAGK